MYLYDTKTAILNFFEWMLCWVEINKFVVLRISLMFFTNWVIQIILIQVFSQYSHMLTAIIVEGLGAMPQSEHSYLLIFAGLVRV